MFHYFQSVLACTSPVPITPLCRFLAGEEGEALEAFLANLMEAPVQTDRRSVDGGSRFVTRWF